MLSLLRQPRYAALSALMAVVALVCVGAGTWQIFRFEQKVHENDDLRANAKAAPATVTSLLPLVGSRRPESRSRVEFRPVRVAGSYDASGQTLVRNRSVGDANGFLVLTPLRTAHAVLLVVRGFLPVGANGAAPAIPPPPGGSVTLLARAHTPESRHDQAGALPAGQVESINASDQAARLGAPTFDGYVELQAHQPGSSGLTALPEPDLSNPAGGALEPQHFAYVIQWYLFAALALAAPFVMARAEAKQSRPKIDFDEASDPDADEPGTADEHETADEPGSADESRAAKLADRYGRPVR